ncbi:prepilin-type N-terminal cleavage/methylation domain-containing protein [Candidatus Coxiella mudrowiae]
MYKKGITLLEVILAITISALIITFSIRYFNDGRIQP